MPQKPKRPCRHPGCAELTDGQYCGHHQKQADARYNRYERDPATRKRYGRDWEKIRARYIRAHPLCERCQSAGRIKKADEVHHKLPLSKGGTHDESNLMSLCESCHSEITAREGGRWRRR